MINKRLRSDDGETSTLTPCEFDSSRWYWIAAYRSRMKKHRDEVFDRVSPIYILCRFDSSISWIRRFASSIVRFLACIAASK